MKRSYRPAVLLSVALISITACARRDATPPADPVPTPGGNAEPKQPEPKQPDVSAPRGMPIDPATVAAWEQAGFKLVSFGSVETEKLPGFALTKSITVETLTRLPKPTVFFFVDLSKVHVTVEALKPLTDLKALAAVHIVNTSMTDELLEHFAAVGFHRLTLAMTPGGKPPAGPEEITDLYLSLSSVTDAGLKHLAGLKNLTKLDLTNTKVTDAGMKDLTGLTKLRELGLTQTAVTDAGLESLAGLKSLTKLELVSAPVTDAGMKHLAGLPNLTVLNMSGTKVTDAGLAHLGRVTTLTTLSLPKGVTGAGLKHLAGLTNLTTLDLTFTQVRFDLKPLSGLKRLTTLRVNLRETPLSSVAEAGLLHAMPQATAADGGRPNGPEDVAHLNLHQQSVFDHHLPAVAGMKNLTTLDLSGTHVTGKGLKDLTGLTKLTELKLGVYVGDRMTDDASLEHVAAFSNLTTFTLYGPRVTDAGLKHLAGLKNLKMLRLSETEVSDAGVKHLVGLTNLTTLHLSAPGMTDAGFEYLAKLTTLRELGLRASSRRVMGEASVTSSASEAV